LRLYSGTAAAFINDAVQNQVAEKLKASFFDYFRYNPGPAEVSSWRNSLRALSQVFQYSGFEEQGIMLEYTLPMSSRRIDCIICGGNRLGKENAVVIELKQWEKCAQSPCENLVLTRVGGAERETLHPSVQVGQYHQYLLDMHPAFYSNAPIALDACAYLHNYTPQADDELFSPKFSETVAKYPLFTGGDVSKLRDFLKFRVSQGKGLGILSRIESEKLRPSKKLMQHVAQVIDGKKEYVLLDEQKVVYEKVLSLAKVGKAKTALIIRGGPGTGKSVIALNLMAGLLRQGYNAQYATGSKSFTETLRKIIGSRGSVQFKYFNSYMAAPKNSVDVLICDEAHRIRETSNNRFTRRESRSDKAQIDELLETARLSVFFIDDDQIVRPNEIGSTDYIRKRAAELGCKVLDYELEAQFRCNGSDAFINWVNNTLGVRRTANVIWDLHEEFDFKTFPTPGSLEAAIREKAGQGHSARLTAGFCWDWSMPNPDGTLKDDVVIGDFKRPWDAKHEATKLAPGIPRASLWAYDPNGINQIGCIYTAQGFEFDYVGVIFGKDLIYDFAQNNWVGKPEHSADSTVRRDKKRFTELVKNVYRVLLTRGMKGCYVHFMDKETEKFFKTRIEGDTSSFNKV